MLPRKNIEIKSRCADLESVHRLAVALGAREADVLHQCDTFFDAPKARLKLREFGDGTAELISYVRPDNTQARASEYHLAKVTQPTSLTACLTHALGTTGTVSKRRQLLLYRNTRIHLDAVEGLGTFVELETVVTDQTDAQAHDELRQVAEALQLRAEDSVSEPYVALLGR